MPNDFPLPLKRRVILSWMLALVSALSIASPAVWAEGEETRSDSFSITSDGPGILPAGALGAGQFSNIQPPDAGVAEVQARSESFVIPDGSSDVRTVQYSTISFESKVGIDPDGKVREEHVEADVGISGSPEELRAVFAHATNEIKRIQKENPDAKIDTIILRLPTGPAEASTDETNLASPAGMTVKVVDIDSADIATQLAREEQKNRWTWALVRGVVNGVAVAASLAVAPDVTFLHALPIGIIGGSISATLMYHYKTYQEWMIKPSLLRKLYWKIKGWKTAKVDEATGELEPLDQALHKTEEVSKWTGIEVFFVSVLETLTRKMGMGSSVEMVPHHSNFVPWLDPYLDMMDTAGVSTIEAVCHGLGISDAAYAAPIVWQISKTVAKCMAAQGLWDISLAHYREWAEAKNPGNFVTIRKHNSIAQVVVSALSVAGAAADLVKSPVSSIIFGGMTLTGAIAWKVTSRLDKETRKTLNDKRLACQDHLRTLAAPADGSQPPSPVAAAPKQ
jgi:hypothetical protein